MPGQNEELTLANSCAQQNRILSHSWKSGIGFPKEPVGTRCLIDHSEPSDQLPKGYWDSTA